LIVAELTPGQLLKAEMQRLGLSQADLAVRMGYSPSSVYRLATDRGRFTPGIDRSLHRTLGSELGSWLGAYQAFRERLGQKP
jgi:transcriptional regulator with XRE-family HTH domain